MSVQNTVKDLSRAIARLDENALAENHTDMRRLVADGIAYHVTRSFGNSWGAKAGHTTRSITTRDVRFILAAHGASTLTIEQHARAIASLIRTYHYWGN